jgi:hypothetical protein
MVHGGETGFKSHRVSTASRPLVNIRIPKPIRYLSGGTQLKAFPPVQ